MLIRYGKKQAESIIAEAFSGEKWYQEVIRGEEEMEISFSGAPQGYESQNQPKTPSLNLKSLGGMEEQDDFCNQRLNLTNLRHLLTVKKYLQKHGGWVPMAVQGRGSCLFHAVRRGINIPKQYTNRLIRRELAVYCARNADIIRNQHLSVLKGEYGFSQQSGQAHEECGLHEGPYSIRTYIKNIGKPWTWGDSVCLDMISRMWDLRITILDTQDMTNLKEKRIRHQLPMEEVDMVLLFDGKTHYSGAIKMEEVELFEEIKQRASKIKVRALRDAPGEIDGNDTEDYEDSSDDDCPDPWNKDWVADIEPRSYFKKGPQYKTTLGEATDPLPAREEAPKVLMPVILPNLGTGESVMALGKEDGKVTHCEKEMTENKCDTCFKTFSGKDTLARHKRQVHVDPQDYITKQCNWCSKSNFKNIRYWQNHLKQCKNRPDKPTFSCIVMGCGKVYRKKSVMQKHLREKHLLQ